MLKHAASHHCEVSTLGILAFNLNTFLKVSQRGSFLENWLQNLNGVTNFSKKNF